MSSPYRWEFVFYNLAGEKRTLEIQADDLTLVEWEGYVLARDTNGKTRASARKADFVALFAPEGRRETIDVDDRHLQSEANQ